MRPKTAVALSRSRRRQIIRSRHVLNTEPAAMNDSRAVAPADEHNDEATKAVQTALDRRDNGGKATR